MFTNIFVAYRKWNPANIYFFFFFFFGGGGRRGPGSNLLYSVHFIVPLRNFPHKNLFPSGKLAATGSRYLAELFAVPCT